MRNPHILRWTRILSHRNHKISVISSDKASDKPDGVDVKVCLSENYDNHLKKIWHELDRASKIGRIINEISPDIVHVHSFDYIHPLMFSIVKMLTAKFPSLVVSTWGTDVLGDNNSRISWRNKLSKRVLLRHARAITATTRFLANETVKLAPGNKKVHVIPFGIDCTQFSKRKSEKKMGDHTIKIGFVKHLKTKYGPEYLLKAMCLIARQYPETRLIMVGGGELETSLKALSVKLGIEKKTIFTGAVKYDDVPGILSNIDIFAMPSIYNSETFGVAAIEAQAMEIPVVASNIGGIPEAVKDGETGLLVEPKNEIMLAEAIARLIENPGMRYKMGRAGRNFVNSNFNIIDNAISLERIYYNTLN